MTLQQELAIADHIAELLDNKFKIGPWRFGLDPIIGLIPGIGDAIPVALSVYLIYIGVHNHCSKATIARMMFYTVADFVIGTVPIVGDTADFFFKASTKNMELLKADLGIAPATNKNR